MDNINCRSDNFLVAYFFPTWTQTSRPQWSIIILLYEAPSLRLPLPPWPPWKKCFHNRSLTTRLLRHVSSSWLSWSIPREGLVSRAGILRFSNCACVVTRSSSESFNDATLGPRGTLSCGLGCAIVSIFVTVWDGPIRNRTSPRPATRKLFSFIFRGSLDLPLIFLVTLCLWVNVRDK